jgi:hypothetical protein
MVTQSTHVCLCLKVQQQVIYPLEGDPNVWNPRFSSSIAVWHWTFLWLPGQNIDVDTSLFLFNTDFYFPLSSLFVHKCHKSRHS